MPELPARKRARFIEEIRPARIRRRGADRHARRQRILRDRRRAFRAIRRRRQLGDGRPDGRCSRPKARRSPNRRLARSIWATWCSASRRARSRASWPRRSSRRCLPPANRRRHHRTRRSEADQRHRRAGEDHRRGDRHNPKQVEQYRGGKTTRDQLLGGPGHEGHARPGQRGVVTELLKRNWGGNMLKEGDEAPDIQRPHRHRRGVPALAT